MSKVEKDIKKFYKSQSPTILPMRRWKELQNHLDVLLTRKVANTHYSGSCIKRVAELYQFLFTERLLKRHILNS